MLQLWSIAFEYSPCSQSLHSEAPGSLVCPSKHALHVRCRAFSEYVPLTQRAHGACGASMPFIAPAEPFSHCGTQAEGDTEAGPTVPVVSGRQEVHEVEPLEEA